MRPWTPFTAYETAVVSLVQATKDFAAVQQTTHTARPTSLATHRRKVEAYERIMSRAYSLLAAEASQTHTTSLRIGAIFTNGDLPSYEDSTGLSFDTLAEPISGVRRLKEQEQRWYIWWKSLNEGSPMQASDLRKLWKHHSEMSHYASGGIKTLDHEMDQVKQYLQDVENGARKFLHDIDMTNHTWKHKRGSRHARSGGITEDTLVKGQTLPPTVKKQRTHEVKRLETATEPRRARSGVCSWWMLKSFSTATPKGQPDKRKPAHDVAGSMESSQAVPFRKYQVQAIEVVDNMHEDYKPGVHLTFTTGQMMEILGNANRNWLRGRYTDAAGRIRTGCVPFDAVMPYHPEISPRAARLAGSRPEARLGNLSASETIGISKATIKLPITKRVASLCAWLEREHEHFMRHEICAVTQPDLILDWRERWTRNIQSLMSKLDILDLWLEENKREDLAVEDLMDLATDLRAKVIRHL